MSFLDWLFSSYPNPSINGQWGLLHIITLVLVIGIIITSTLLLRNKSTKAKKILLWVLVCILIIFELTRRVVNFCKTDDLSLHNILHILLPRPGCAISSLLIVLAICVNKKPVYNCASILSILCAGIFFIYPGVGFNNEFILFENLYSIATHSLILTIAILYITLKYTDFKYKTIWKDIVGLAIIFVYVFLEIFVLKIESDPLYFMPGSDIQGILGVSYGAFLPIYILIFIVIVNLFYLINDKKYIFNIVKKKYKGAKMSFKKEVWKSLAGMASQLAALRNQVYTIEKIFNQVVSKDSNGHYKISPEAIEALIEDCKEQIEFYKTEMQSTIDPIIYSQLQANYEEQERRLVQLMILRDKPKEKDKEIEK